MNANGAPAYAPYRWAAADFQLGLRPARLDQWILLSPNHPQIMREKRARLRESMRFYRSLPESLEAQGELSRRVVDHLVKDHAEAFELAHIPVPTLTDKLGSRIDRVLDSVHEKTACERFNWQVTPLATLFFPQDNPHDANAAAMHRVVAQLRERPERAGELLFIRVERQTLSRLPKSQAVTFSLHTYSDPLSSLRSVPAGAQTMLQILEAYSEERWRYGEMDIVREPLLAYLRFVAGACS